MEKNKEEVVMSDLDIKKWSEGNAHLEKLLINCRENNIPSMFCCAGHGKNRPAYITVQMNDETLGKIYNIINSISDENNISFRFAQKEFGVDPSFTIYMLNEKNKNNIMDNLSEATKKEINIDCLPNNFKQCFKLTEILKNNDLGFDLEYNIGKGKNNLSIQNIKYGNAQYIEKKDFKDMGFKSRKDMFGKYNYYITNISRGNKENKVFNNIIERLNKIYNNEIEENNLENLNFKQRVQKQITSNKLLKKLPFVNKVINNNLKLLPENTRKKR